MAIAIAIHPFEGQQLLKRVLTSFVETTKRFVLNRIESVAVAEIAMLFRLKFNQNTGCRLGNVVACFVREHVIMAAVRPFR